jgi:hypothetical protein
MDLSELEKRRLESWCQDGKHRIADPGEAVKFIDRVGICPLYRASDEFPDLFHGHTSDPTLVPDASWDSISGEIYTWRWKIGGTDGAFYAALVGKKPTWVSWKLLPDVLAAFMDRRTPDELFDLGLLSANGHKIAAALEEAGGVLSTKDLRKQAGFPTGKENRKNYLKAIEELESFLWLAKKTSEGVDDMSHALIPTFYKEQAEYAYKTDPANGLKAVLAAYVEGARFVRPAAFAKAFRIKPDAVMGAVVSPGLLKLDENGKTIYYKENL